MSRGPGARAPRSKPSLRIELLFNLSVLAGGALLLALASATVAPLFGQGPLGLVLMVALVGADLLIFVAFGRLLVARLVTRPMETLVEATQAVAGGELTRRAPEGNTRELDRLATSVNRMTERLLDAQGALVRAEKLASVGRLAAGVAHEIGNPLAAIDNYVELLRRHGADPELVRAVAREAERMDAIVRSLLDYARPRDAAREPLDVGEVAAGAVELLRTQGVLRGVAVEADRGRDLPRVLADRAALEQVFVNLLLNAVDAVTEGNAPRVVTAVGRDPAAGAKDASGAKAGSAGTSGAGPGEGGTVRGGHIGVVASAARLGPAAEAVRRRTDAGLPAAERHEHRGEHHLWGKVDGALVVQVVVGDSGAGVPPDLAGKIFDPFFTTKPPGRGTGLGLAIVQRTVEDHGGRVDIARAREGGAAFIVTLPAIER